jgi:hypothetical protein
MCFFGVVEVGLCQREHAELEDVSFLLKNIENDVTERHKEHIDVANPRKLFSLSSLRRLILLTRM